MRAEKALNAAKVLVHAWENFDERSSSAAPGISSPAKSFATPLFFGEESGHFQSDFAACTQSYVWKT